MAEHAGGMERGDAGRQHRDRQARAQGSEAGVADGIDAQRVEALPLRAEAGGDHSLLHDGHVVVAVGQGRHPARAHEGHLDVRTLQRGR
ncbi:hypothetical protein FQZ97_339570 [compost metagenome]